MRDLKIGKKIMLGFGLVIVLMLVMFGVVAITNMQSISNVKRISVDSQLQVTSNSMLDSFNAARINANVIYNVINQEANQQFVKNADEAERYVDELNLFIDKNKELETFRDDLNRVRDDFRQWRSKVEAIIECSNQLEANQSQLLTYGAKMSEVSTVISDTQMETVRTTLANDPASMAYVIEGMEISNRITEDITKFRTIMLGVLRTYDYNAVDAAIGYMDEAVQYAESYRDGSHRQIDRENAEDVINSIREYRQASVQFGELCRQLSQSIGETRPIGDSVTATMFEVLNEIDDAMSTQVNKTRGAAGVSLVLSLLISLISITTAILFALVIVRSITQPVKEIVNAADAIALGDVDVHIDYESRDELGTLANSFRTMAQNIKLQAKEVGRIAEGDFSVDIRPRSDKDTMNISLHNMVIKMNETFSEIQNSAQMVSQGANQMSNGAQLLAQGSAEQASTIEELSASICEVSGKTSENAQQARVAAELSNEIRNKAEQGNEQMNQMITAVNEINEASASIGKVIKSIDEIAFQTNILALNAAVEAARAGQHGKGFAVVADEVRNLAGKSADAAKDSAALIQGSIEKAQLGMEMANETAVSLSAIVSGINESSAMVEGIANASDEQLSAINQINEAISQVSQVVQQNSATSQESAASSEEMNSQATILEKMVAQFKLSQPSAFRETYEVREIPTAESMEENDYSPY